LRLVALAGLSLGTAFCSDAQEPTSTPTPALASTAQSAATQFIAQGGTQEGEFVTYVADFDDGHSERWHAFKPVTGGEIKLAFDTPPNLVSGSKVRVTGDLVSEAIHVRNVELLEAPAQAAPPTLDSPPSPDTYGLVLVDLGGGVNIDAGSAETTMFSSNPADKSFASFYFESSYGKYSVTGAVLGPYQFSMTTCDTTGMETAIEAQITQPFNHLIYYFNRSTLCTFGGLGEEGSVNAPAKRTWMNGSLSCVVLMQEPGHNLGLMHANTIACGTASFSTTPATSCTITEYGSTVTPMGSGCHQLNGYEKWYEQWLTGCNGVRVTDTGTFNLVPLGDSCPGAVQVLQVPMPATLTVNDPQATTTNVSLKNYYVELRAAAGSFDGYNAAGRAGGAGGGVTYTGPTVYVYASDDVHTGAAPARGQTTPTRNSVWTELINMNPASTTFTGLTTAGQSFVDPAGGATITLQSISATGAVIGVNVPNGSGGPTCIDGTTLTGTGGACDGGAVVIPPFDAGTIIPPPVVDSGAKDATTGDATTGGARDSGAPAGDGGITDSGTGTSTGSSSGSTTTGSSGSSSGAGGGATTGSSSGASTTPSDASATSGFNPGAEQRPGCGCETVGGTPAQNRHGAWIALGLVFFGGWGTRRRRERRKAEAAA
jgi:MYXO-CTERM domain-containing protein